MIPDKLPCRDEEKWKIKNFIDTGIETRGSSSSLYISGMPGTGKTATTLEILRHIEQNAKEYRDIKIKIIKINGMTLQNPHQVYSLMWEGIKGDWVNPTTAAI